MITTLRDARILLTGASGGIGEHLFDFLTSEGARMALVAFPGAELVNMAQTTTAKGGTVFTLASDLRISSEWERVADWAVTKLGGVDILINNAGIEFTSEFHQLTRENISDILRVNLEAPMMLAHALLPRLLKQGRGHIVNMSSLAGRASPALQEVYAATKAGLVGFTSSLRASYRHYGISASVICPGFVEAGIYPRIRIAAGRPAPPLLGACPAVKVCAAVRRAILTDAPEIIVTKYPVRPLLALTALAPRLGEWTIGQFGVHDFFRRAAEQAKADRSPT